MFDYLRKTSIINLKEFTVDSINDLDWQLTVSFKTTKIFYILSTVLMNTNQLERLSWKMANAIIVANTKWVSIQLIACGRAKLVQLGKEHLDQLMLITELLLIWAIPHMDPHLTDWVTKSSQVPQTGNLPICQIVIHFSFLHTYSPLPVNSVIIFH